MELDESINFVDSEAVNAYGSVVAKEEHKNPVTSQLADGPTRRHQLADV